MKIPVIKKLVDGFDLETLKKAEEQLLEELKPEIEIEGKDEGEQLTHVMAAIWIKEDMEKTGDEYLVSLRRYTSKVRESIS